MGKWQVEKLRNAPKLPETHPRAEQQVEQQASVSVEAPTYEMTEEQAPQLEQPGQEQYEQMTDSRTARQTKRA